MKYDFDKPINRQGTHCVKWDMAPHSAPEGAPTLNSPLDPQGRFRSEAEKEL